MPDGFAGLTWVIAAAFGVALLAICIKYLRMIWVRRRTWVLTDATVGKVRVRRSSAADGDGGTVVNYHYTDQTGQQHMGVDEPTFRKPKRSSKLRVRYDPENPGMSEAVMPLWVELALATGGVASGTALLLFGLSGLKG